MSRGDQDPIFNLQIPAFFAHRGGAGETVESTIEGFLHGLLNGANILEVDVQLSNDSVAVVWHGPELDIVSNEQGQPMTGKYVSCLKWEELQKLQVERHHEPKPECEKPEGDNRWIISLSQLLDFVIEVKQGKYGSALALRPINLNIELKKISKKGSCTNWPSWTANKVASDTDFYPNLHQVLNILEKAPEGVISVVGSVDYEILFWFRQVQRDKYGVIRYKTNLSIREQLPYAGLFTAENVRYIGFLAPILNVLLLLIGALAQIAIGRKKNLADYAFETPSSIITSKLVQEVHSKDGGIYLFLSPFPVLHQPEDKETIGTSEYRKTINHLLDIGVDGLMADYPCELNKIL